MIQHAHRELDTYTIDGDFWLRTRNGIAFVALISIIAAVAGFLIHPARFYQSYLVAFLFCATIPLAAMFYVMVQYLTGAAWSIPMRRIAENIMMTIPVGALLFLPVLAGVHSLYEWSHAEEVAHDAILRAKAGYLNERWFAIRAGIFFLLWSVWAWRIYRHSTTQDRTKSLDHMHAISRWSAPGLLMLFLSASLASFDWSMSLNPHWYSTIFGLYVLSGAAWAFVALWTLICILFRERRILANTIHFEHYHDLGKWMFALTVFWAYISFSQYMLIWYANLPEETIWFMRRFEGSWGAFSAFLLFGHFIIPFWILIARAAKRKLKLLKWTAVWMLFMQYCDFYWQVMPTFYRGGFVLHWLDLACLGAVGSGFALVFWFRMKAHAMLPVGDPRFEQGLQFQNL